MGPFTVNQEGRNKRCLLVMTCQINHLRKEGENKSLGKKHIVAYYKMNGVLSHDSALLRLY